jgi:glycosyltransferase involved in cell wall biosynthesis
VIIVADGGSPDAHHLAKISGLSDKCKVRVLDLLPAGGDFGQPARNFGMAKATGSHLVFTQDDNAFIEGALLAVKHEAELHPAALHFWRVRPQGGQWVWTHVPADGLPHVGQIDADCGVVPNDPTRLASWGDGYNGDADFWRATAERFLPAIVWHEELISGHQRFL